MCLNPLIPKICSANLCAISQKKAVSNFFIISGKFFFYNLSSSFNNKFQGTSFCATHFQSYCMITCVQASGKKQNLSRLPLITLLTHIHILVDIRFSAV